MFFRHLHFLQFGKMIPSNKCWTYFRPIFHPTSMGLHQESEWNGKFSRCDPQGNPQSHDLMMLFRKTALQKCVKTGLFNILLSSLIKSIYIYVYLKYIEKQCRIFVTLSLVVTPILLGLGHLQVYCSACVCKTVITNIQMHNIGSHLS